ncbi:MAG: hypothetical protein ACT6TH_08850 [Brevundimonas sp.]|uniref:hypothetical protein n=1 Tax=Brevundimonas sp. TaxID=1871086 RepID=UPI0040337979
MKALRFIIVLVVLGYAGWLAWPFIQPLISGGPGVAEIAAEANAEAGGDLFGVIPAWAFWAGAVVLYLVAALMLGSGNPRAAIAYFLGFIADAALRLALDRNGGSGEVAARSTGPTTMAAPDSITSSLPVDPLWLVLGALVVLGVLVLIASRRIRRKRVAGQFAY